jgi:hypothetical protein
MSYSLQIKNTILLKKMIKLRLKIMTNQPTETHARVVKPKIPKGIMKD